MRKFVAAALMAASLGLGFVAVAGTAPASAQGIVITPNGVRIYPGDPTYNRYDRRFRRNVDRQDAVFIAKRRGVGQVRSVSRVRNDWLVVGDAARGRGNLRVRVDGRTGGVVSVTRVVR